MINDITSINRSVVIMPTYNPPPTYFKLQTESILSQLNRNDLLLIADDASNNNSELMFEELKKTNTEHVIIFNNDKRLGVINNVYNLIRKSISLNADVIFLSDQDDYWLPGKLKRYLEILKERDDAVLIIGSGLVVNENLKFLAMMKPIRPASLFHYLFETPSAGMTFCFTRKFGSNFLQFIDNRNINMYHDNMIAAYALSKASIIFDDEPQVLYIQHSQNLLGYGRKVNGLFAKIKHFHIKINLMKERFLVGRYIFGFGIRDLFFARLRSTWINNLILKLLIGVWYVF
jgi:glycosyltransferase involved in cell wall biosynthesis